MFEVIELFIEKIHFKIITLKLSLNSLNGRANHGHIVHSSLYRI